MAHPLDGARLKLMRAEEHLNAFEEESTAYLSSNFCSFAKVEDGEFCHFFLIQNVSPPLRLSAILGDCVHNMRSSLDHLAWQLVLANGQSPTRQTAFPIFKNDEAYQGPRAQRLVKGMRTEAIEIINELQPYYGGHDPLNHPLWFLHELDNADKHRTLNLTQGQMVLTGLRIITRVGDVAPSSLSTSVVRHGGRIGSFRLADYSVDEYVKVEGHGPSLVTLQDNGPWAQDPVVVLAARTLEYIRGQVYPRFEPFFSAMP
jgi:hypothetical protein